MKGKKQALGKVAREEAREEARVDLNDITAPIGKCKQRAEITVSHGMWGMTRLKPSIGESEPVEEHVQGVLIRPPSEGLEAAERGLRNCSFVRSRKSEIKF